MLGNSAGELLGLIFCRGSFYGFVGSPHAKRNVVNHLIFQSEFPVFPYKGSGTPDLWTLSFSSVMSCVLYARSKYICLDLVNGVWIKIIYIYIYIFYRGFVNFPVFHSGAGSISFR